MPPRSPSFARKFLPFSKFVCSFALVLPSPIMTWVPDLIKVASHINTEKRNDGIIFANSLDS